MGMLELILSKGGGTVIVIVLFGGVCYLLRYLYGPGGKYRDPHWDILNAEARQEEAIDVLAAKVQKAVPEIDCGPFVKYAQSFMSGDADVDQHLRLKVEHTLHVLANAQAIAEQEQAFAAPEARRALLLAALYHDVGRFEQFRRYRTFADALSCNHGTLGAKALRKGGGLRTEPAALRRMVLTAVAAHNRHSLPVAFSGLTRTVTEGVRDADKLDILRVMQAHLGPGVSPDPVVLMHLKDDPQNYSPTLLQALEQGRTASFLDMRCYNDFRLLLCSWLYDFTFPASLSLLQKSGRLDTIIAGLEGVPEVQARAEAAVQKFFADRAV